MINFAFLTTISITFVLTLILVGLIRNFSNKLQIGHDKDEGVQKFHALTTSRLGGVGLILGTLMGIGLSVKPMPNVASLGGWLLIASIPVFAGGLIEDLTHSVSAGLRLLLSLLSALFVWVVLDVGVTRTDIQWKIGRAHV